MNSKMKFVGNWGRLGMKFNIWEDCPKVPITELLSFIVDNRGKTVPTANDGWKLIATNCVTNNTLFPVYEKVRYFTQETYETWFRAHPMPGDILFVNKGTPGRVCMVPDPVDFCIAQDMIALRADDKKIYNKYLFAVLRSREIQQQIYNTNVGDVIPHFKKQFMDQLLIPVPDRKIQEKIGNLYYQLSYKVELNKKINENLADQAQAIYQQYFLIEADPNWPLGHLSDLIDVKYGKDHKKLADGVYPVYGSGGIMRYVERPLYEKESVLIPRKGTLNNVMYVNQPFWSVDTMFYTEMKQANVAKFVYHFVKSKDLASMNAGSAVPSMTTAILNALELRIPSAEALLQFENSVAPMYEMMKKNEDQSRKLTELRDALLPKLMSGEIDVSDLDL